MRSIDDELCFDERVEEWQNAMVAAVREDLKRLVMLVSQVPTATETLTRVLQALCCPPSEIAGVRILSQELTCNRKLHEMYQEYQHQSNQ